MSRNQLRIELEKKPFAGGRSFGDVGPYERLHGRAYYAIDPNEPGLPRICDLDLAPRNADGLVEFAGTLDIIKPVDLNRGRKRVLYEFSNRGGRAAITGLCFGKGQDMAAPEYAGDGFLMREGYSIVWSGWQGDIRETGANVALTVPQALENGRPLRGTIRQEFSSIREGELSMGISAGGENADTVYPNPVVNPETATLTAREHERDPRVPVPRSEWEFAKAEMKDGRLEVTPSNEHLYVHGGFKPGWLYELIYETEGSRLTGLGFLGVRDLLSMIRFQKKDSAGNDNPLAGYVDKLYATGGSLCGRVIRQYVYEGWNADAEGRKLFDAVHTHTGTGRVLQNIRFPQVGRFPRQHEEHDWPSEVYPFTYIKIPDPFTGKVDGLWKRPETDPLVIHLHTEGDYWIRHVSPAHTDLTDGGDIELPEDKTRMYNLTGAPHMSRPVNDAIWIGQLTPNSMSAAPYRRAIMRLLDEWATNGTPPPPSLIPRKSDGTLVKSEEALAAYPKMPGVNLPAGPSRLVRYDYGPDFWEKGIQTVFPPKPLPDQEYPIRVPMVDADGNPIAGIRYPDVEVPLGTYTGWSLRKKGFAEGDQFWNTGSFVPFARTKAEREASGDPRPSIEERYRDHDDYVSKVTACCDKLVQERLLLRQDADRMIDAAKSRNPFDPSVQLGPLIFVLTGPGG